MNTRASTYRHMDIAWSATASPIYIESVALLLICTTLAIGAYLSFPLYDDGWLRLVLRESGPHFLSRQMGDRPVFGFLLGWISSFGAGNRFVFVLLNAVIWLVFAIESGILFRKLFPEFSDYAIVAACLTLAPIVVQTQLSTALVVIPANLATILGYAGILVLLRNRDLDKPARAFELGIAMVLAASGIAISEYGVATNFVGCAILIGMALTSSSRMIRRRLIISTVSLFTVTFAVYFLFAKMVDFSVRPDVAPAHVLHRGIAKWIEVPFDIISGTGHSLVGAYAAALGTVTLAWDSKSTLIGILFGILVAFLICFAIQSRQSEHSVENPPDQFSTRFVILLQAILVGLLPFSVMGRATTLLEFGSRFRIPIMPVAAATTIGFALYVVRTSARWIPVVVFGFIIGYSTWISSYTSVEQARAIAGLQGALISYVAQSDGYTVVVVPFKRFETELTANIASTWPLDLEKRLWVVSQAPALLQFGNRRDCRPSALLTVQVRGLNRTGKLNQLLWVEAPSSKPVSIEPYCKTSN